MWQRSHEKGSLDEIKLELRLAPPGEQNEKSIKNTLNLQDVENNAFSMPSSVNSALSNRSQNRNGSSPVVGWPPIRSYRKNIATGGSSKSPTESRLVVPDTVEACNKPINNSCKGLFVKIHMDGVPIGRKININAYDSYEKLSSAVDQLFRSLLEEMNLSHYYSAKRDSSRNNKKQEEDKSSTGSLIGSGEYTLVYEDNEGDKMLVGDVPWHMFVSTVKRLRVSKTSDIPAFNLGSKKD
ncbi:auxin-responsive protein IAA28-like [Cicer arietinum]|uniref:Auxin-induced protein n=1 Tax=Cicer arietinum TaxID=3827 RepID=A0A1S2YUX4_CICAR|nr:auxin-responsive protein IAA26-like [Cicer arietinum]